MTPELSLPEWTVLALVDEAPTHGFAVARLTGRDGELGRVWQIPRPVVYRAVGRLQDAALVAPVGNEPGLGPRRRLVASTASGRAAVAAWLTQPVQHVRDVRSHLLTKLALLDRRGDDPTPLLTQQRAVLAPIVDALVDTDADPRADDGTEGEFARTLAVWRRANASAVIAFLDEVAAQPSGR